MELKRLNRQATLTISATFNRTSMELKHTRACCPVAPACPFNRTSMELKLGSLSSASGGDPVPFNRTSMELKLERVGLKLLYSGLLIEPVWN